MKAFGVDLRKNSGFSTENSGSCIVLAQSGVAKSLTGTLVLTDLAKIIVPGGLIGPNGTLRVTTSWSVTNNANVKSLRAVFGGVSTSLLLGITTSAYVRHQFDITNRGSLASQTQPTAMAASFGSSSGVAIATAIDTTVDQPLIFRGLLAVDTDVITLESYNIEVLNPF